MKTYDVYFEMTEDDYIIHKGLLALQCDVIMTGYCNFFYNALVEIRNDAAYPLIEKKAAFICPFPYSDEDEKRLDQFLGIDTTDLD